MFVWVGIYLLDLSIYLLIYCLNPQMPPRRDTGNNNNDQGNNTEAMMQQMMAAQTKLMTMMAQFMNTQNQ